MRVILRAMIPTIAGNKMVKDPNLLKTIEDFTKKFNCEVRTLLKLMETGLWYSY